MSALPCFNFCPPSAPHLDNTLQIHEDGAESTRSRSPKVSARTSGSRAPPSWTSLPGCQVDFRKYLVRTMELLEFPCMEYPRIIDFADSNFPSERRKSSELGVRLGP